MTEEKKDPDKATDPSADTATQFNWSACPFRTSSKRMP